MKGDRQIGRRGGGTRGRRGVKGILPWWRNISLSKYTCGFPIGEVNCIFISQGAPLP